MKLSNKWIAQHFFVWLLVIMAFILNIEQALNVLLFISWVFFILFFFFFNEDEKKIVSKTKNRIVIFMNFFQGTCVATLFVMNEYFFTGGALLLAYIGMYSFNKDNLDVEIKNEQ